MQSTTRIHRNVTREMALGLIGFADGLPRDGRWVEGQTQAWADLAVRSGSVVGASTTPALLLEPAQFSGVSVLYAHAHGNRYDIGKTEVIDGRPALLDPPLGAALARAGHRVLCQDMPGFGERQQEGTESALSKAALWRGRTLLGDMLADLSAGVTALQALAPATPVVTVGISMGATLAYWLAALDQRVAACAHMCAFANIAPLIACGGHDLHGPYMTVPGLLELGDMADIAGLIAPRPQMVGAGLQDPLTPPAAFDSALAILRHHYSRQPEALVTVTEPDAGHHETVAMRKAVFDLCVRVGTIA